MNAGLKAVERPIAVLPDALKPKTSPGKCVSGSRILTVKALDVSTDHPTELNYKAYRCEECFGRNRGQRDCPLVLQRERGWVAAVKGDC